MIVLISILLQGRSKFAAPYDSTQGVPGFVFLFAWVLIALFLIRLAWEYRDKFFTPKNPTPEESKVKKKGKEEIGVSEHLLILSIGQILLK